MKKDKNGKPAGTGPAPDPPSMDDLERAPKPEETKKENAAAEKAPEKKAAEAKRPKLSDADKSRAMGIAATAVCVIGAVLFVLSQIFFPGSRQDGRPSGNADPAPSQQSQPSGSPAQGPGNGEIELDPPSAGGENTGAWDSPLDRAPWDYRLETDDGGPAADGQGAEVGSGTRYWMRSRSGENAFQITVPAGYTVVDLGDSVELSVGDPAVTGNDPLSFKWQAGAVPRILVEEGYYDYLERSGTTGYAEYAVRAVGYYLFDDAYGTEWPVVAAQLVRTAENREMGEIEDYAEYWIVVGKPVDGQYLTGRIPADAFYGLATQRCPDITSLAKALFPVSSSPGMPAAWSAEPETAAPDDGGQDAGIPQDGYQDAG